MRSAWASGRVRAGVLLALAVVGLPRMRSQADTKRWIAVYGAGPSTFTDYPPYTIDDLTRLIATVDTTGHPVAWLSSGVLLLNIYSASGRLFATWGPSKRAVATGTDWEAFIDSLFASGGLLSRLDSAAALVERAAGTGGEPLGVSVMIPYPEPRADTMRFHGDVFDVSALDGRVALATAYVHELRRRVRALSTHRLRFDGCLWLREDVPPGDTDLVRRMAGAIHDVGWRFIWVPYYQAGARRWKDWGFDEAWLQPNYFFDPQVPAARIDSAFALARAWGMGVEIEFDKRLLTSPQFEDRLEPYLSRLEAAPDLRSRAVVIFEGHGGLLDLSRKRDPWHRAVYARFADLIRN